MSQTSDRIDHNQRYHNDEKYILPSDDVEAARLQLQHDLLRDLFEGRIVIAPVQFNGNSRILDIGTGKGAWALDLANSFPNADKAAITCIDIGSRLFPPSHPSNIVFQLGNVLHLPEDWSGRFDFVHQRLLMGALKYNEWEVVIPELYRITKEGGWVQLCESNATSHMGAETDLGPVSTKFMELYQRLCKAVRMDPLCTLRIGPLMEKAGFVNIKIEKRVVGLGEWNGELGRTHGNNVMGVYRGFKTTILRLGGLGMIESEEEYDVLMDDMEGEWKKSLGAASAFYIITGQKPSQNN